MRAHILELHADTSHISGALHMVDHRLQRSEPTRPPIRVQLPRKLITAHPLRADLSITGR
ncbi:hypothetical protein [Nocardia sp. NPDC051463]|uniref:hypothetical protein n=1 Tax=Nocardia sp. NPDC051463 TaxID=3154845 RepID=UPI00342998B2